MLLITVMHGCKGTKLSLTSQLGCRSPIPLGGVEPGAKQEKTPDTTNAM